MGSFNVGVTAGLLNADGSGVMPEVDLSPLTDNPAINVTRLRDVQTGELLGADIETLDAAILFLERIVPATFSDGMPLSLLARFGVGYDTVDVDAATAAGVAVAIAPSGVRRPVATSVVALIMALTHNLMQKDRLTRDTPDGWAVKTDYNGIGLVGRTLAGIGLGNIGSEVFRLMAPFGMRMIAHDPYVDAAHAASLGVELVSLDEAFRQADVLTVNCMLNEETRHLVNAERLGLMQAQAYLINTARGPVVDESALITALQRGVIAGAGIDVFEQEPPAADNPLLSMDNVILSPHALCFTDQCMAGLGQADMDACLALMAGQVPEHLVNPEVTEHPRFRQRLEDYARS